MSQKRRANWTALKITRKMIGAAALPLMAMLEVMPAVIGTSVSQNRASPIPPSGPIAATRTARIVGMSTLFCSSESTIPITKVTRNGWVLKNSRLWLMEAARSFLLVWIFSRPGMME